MFIPFFRYNYILISLLIHVDIEHEWFKEMGKKHGSIGWRGRNLVNRVQMNDPEYRKKSVSPKKPLNATPIEEVTAAQIKGTNPPKEIFFKRKYGGVIHFKLLISNNQRNTYLCIYVPEMSELNENVELLTYWKVQNISVECNNFAHKINDNARWMDTLVASRIKGGVTTDNGTVHHIPNWIRTTLLNIDRINLEETF